jgi:hypothetical protein
MRYSGWKRGFVDLGIAKIDRRSWMRWIWGRGVLEGFRQSIPKSVWAGWYSNFRHSPPGSNRATLCLTFHNFTRRINLAELRMFP